jgi:hypothetical protein
MDEGGEVRARDDVGRGQLKPCSSAWRATSISAALRLSSSGLHRSSVRRAARSARDEYSWPISVIVKPTSRRSRMVPTTSTAERC